MAEDANSICDLLVIGSGSAATSAALRAAEGGLDVLVIEKTEWLGGTSAMSGAGIWMPASHVARAEGVEDSPEDTLAYLRASAPEGWAETEDHLWQSFAANAPRAVEFIDRNTPLEFVVTLEPDPFTEADGGKAYGRQITVRPLSRRLLGPLAKHLRRSTLPHIIAYHEFVALDPYHRPVRAILKLWPRLLWRWLTATRGQGNALMTGMIRGCLDKGVRFTRQTAALRLVQDETGRVTGAEVESGGARRIITARRGVVLATGGFEWNRAMREEHFPGPLNFIGSPDSNTGDGQRMAREAGAALDRMDQANIYPCLPTVYEGHSTGVPHTFTAEKHSILVNRHGRRFVSENDFNIGERMDARDPETGEPVHLPVWLIGDSRFLKQSLAFHWFARRQKGFVTKAATVEELAQKIGLPPEALGETVERFNTFCVSGNDKDFLRGQTTWDIYKNGGRKGALFSLEEPPFVAVVVNRSILGTKGGARTNEKAQVLREDGSIVTGLYAAGLAMANPIGTRAIGAGTTLGPNLTWGFIAAETALSQNE